MITGVSNNEVSFGTNQNGLTAGQLSKITLNGQPAAINNNGQLYVPVVAAVAAVMSSVHLITQEVTICGQNANWTNGIPDHEEAKATIEAASLIIDGNFHLSQLKFSWKYTKCSIYNSNCGE